jgi:hypothetical protein
MSNRTNDALQSEFAESDLGNTTQQEINVNVLAETCDVEKWLARFDLAKASNSELRDFEQECDEAIEAILAAKARARVIRKKNELKKAA